MKTTFFPIALTTALLSLPVHAQPSTTEMPSPAASEQTQPLSPSQEIAKFREIIQTGDREAVAKILPRLEELGKAGHPVALRILGDLYSYPGPVENDGPKAVSYYQASLDAGNRSVLARMGELFRDGTLVLQDYDAAFTYFRAAADDGVPLGKLRLG